MSTTLVMKFGGSSVATTEQFFKIADLIIAQKQFYKNLVIVISAMGKTTDQLIALAHQIHSSPPQREYDMLLTAGERISMSLLAMALSSKGHEAVSFTGSQSGIITCSQHSNARIIDVKPNRIEACLQAGKIAIVAGFQGVSQHKEITTLGRGGSDTSAVALGVALKAEKIEFLKDVNFIYEQDPKYYPQANPFTHLTYEAALKIAKSGAQVMRDRAIELAEKNGMPLHIRSYLCDLSLHVGTIIEDKNKIRTQLPLYEM